MVDPEVVGVVVGSGIVAILVDPEVAGVVVGSGVVGVLVYPGVVGVLVYPGVVGIQVDPEVVDILVHPESAETVSSTIRNVFCRAIFCTNKLQPIVDCSLLHLYNLIYIDCIFHTAVWQT